MSIKKFNFCSNAQLKTMGIGAELQPWCQKAGNRGLQSPKLIIFGESDPRIQSFLYWKSNFYLISRIVPDFGCSKNPWGAVKKSLTFWTGIFSCELMKKCR